MIDESDFAVHNDFNFSAQLVLDCARRTVSVDTLEAIMFLHGFELFLDEALVLDKAAVHV